jgi:GNAT superfamily N-acetyltransferase
MNVAFLKPSAANDDGLVDHLTRLINDVYAVAEAGLWQAGMQRTTPTELAGLIERHEIAVATDNGDIVGTIHVHDVADDTSEFGILVADPQRRNTGIGRALVDFAERQAVGKGHRTMQLELLVPRGWDHPTKEFAKAWYGRRGYEHAATTSMAAEYPHLAALLATECDLRVYRKPLTRAG